MTNATEELVGDYTAGVYADKLFGMLDPPLR
jgi:hypothetical protein